MVLVGSRYAAVVLVVAGLLALTSTASATLSDTPDNVWVPNGSVFTAARSADRIYVGGQFTRVAPLVGGFARFTGGSDQLLSSPPSPTSSSAQGAAVFTTVDDGAGGFYLGGRFDAFGGVPRQHLVHVLADGSLDPAFAPDPDGDVTALARNGSTLYVAGSFTTIGGAARTHLAAVDGAGRATSWAPVLDATPNAIAVSGSTVYLGGSFTTINGAARPNAGAVDAATGATLAWDPQPNNLVYRIAPAGSSVFIGGAFTAVHGTSPVYYLAKVDATTGLPTSWVPTIHSTSPGGGTIISALAVRGSVLYVGGLFDMVDSTARHGAAALDVGTATALQPWNPNPGMSDGLFVPSVSAITLSGSTVYLAGSFQTINGTLARTNAAAVDATTGAATAWAPYLEGDANDLALSGDSIGIAGIFGLAGGVARNNIVALDAGDGTPTSWNPNVNNVVRVIVPDGPAVFLGGDFTTVGNATHHGLAKVDTTSALALQTWTLDLNDVDEALALSGRTLYVGGAFHSGGSFGAVGRNYAGAVDADSAAVSAWAPGPDADVSSIAVAGDIVYLGGSFTSLGSGATARLHVAAVTSAGLPTPWNPAGADGTLALHGSTVFLAGSFAGPTGLEAVDGTSAAPAGPAVAVAANSVDALTTDPSTLFIGGSFATIDGQPRNGLAAIDPESGLLSPWHPVFSGTPTIQHIAVDGRGGLVTSPDFASFSALPQATTPPALSTAAAVGQPIACTNGSWSGSIPQRYAISWLRDGVVIAGGASYTPVAADAGHALGCRVTAMNLGGSTTSESTPTTVTPAPILGPTHGDPGHAPGPGRWCATAHRRESHPSSSRRRRSSRSREAGRSRPRRSPARASATACPRRQRSSSPCSVLRAAAARARRASRRPHG